MGLYETSLPDFANIQVTTPIWFAAITGWNQTVRMCLWIPPSFWPPPPCCTYSSSSLLGPARWVLSRAPKLPCKQTNKTRMHSSRMRSVRWSDRLGGCLPREGVSAWRGVCLGVVLSGGCLPGGVCLGGVHHPPPAPIWTEFLTHTCENITFSQLLLRTAKITSRCCFMCFGL